MTIDADLQRAVKHHEAGAFLEAEQLYRAILQVRPDHPDANHQLGLLAVQLKQHAMALPFLKAALAASPQRTEFRNRYAEALESTGQRDEAQRVRELGRPQEASSGASAGAGAAAPAANGMSTPEQIFEVAGEFVETIATLTARDDHAGAEVLARQMVRMLPNHGFGWKTLAHASLRRGDLDGALEPLSRAVALLPQDKQLHAHLQAAMAMRKGRALDEARHYDEAEKLYRFVVNCYPQFAEANHKLGVVLIRLYQADAAIPFLEMALGLNPNQPQYWMNYVDALLQSGQTRAAWTALEMGQQRGMSGPAVDAVIGVMTSISSQMITMRPRPITASDEAPSSDTTSPGAGIEPSSAGGPLPTQQECDIALAHFNKGRIKQAIVAGRSLAKRFPSHPTGWKVLGVGHYRLGQYDEAQQALNTASKLGPSDVEVLQVLSSLLMSKKLYDEAEARCKLLLETAPDHAEGQRVMGIILSSQGRLKEAEDYTRKSLASTPDSAAVHVSLGAIMLRRGKHTEAASIFRHALTLDPANHMANENLAFCLSHSEEIEPDELFAEHVRYGERFEKPLKKHWKPHRNSKDPARRLQIGFISGDYHHHAVANFVEPVLEHLARDKSLTLHAYSNTPGEDKVTERMKRHFDHWHYIFGAKDDDVAAQVRADRIDILIDLAGHTANNRLLVMARKPAPVQASWIGYPGTTGLTAVDYFLADRFWVPSDAFRNLFTEKIAYLPAVAPFLPEDMSPPVNALPALRNGHVTFGSFNRIEKLRRDVIAMWSKLLHALPGSRMVVGAMPQDSIPEELIGWFADEGIARERLDFKPRSSIPVYLQQHYHVDICLDTFPFTGLTTTLQALWMGVPTLTLPGRTVPGRSGVTALAHVGLEAYIADDMDDYLRKGVALATDLPALAELRSGMRARCAQSPMFNPDVIAIGFAQALRVMWKNWCDGKPAESFEISQGALQAPVTEEA
ncbi:MAG TPA: tetratricopeptide repeat protein [Paraburkholderia sp.]